MINLTAFVNSTAEEWSTVDSQTNIEREDGTYTSDVWITEVMTTRREEATYKSDVWTTDVMTTGAPIVADSLVEQVVTTGLLMLFWLYVNLANGFIFRVVRSDQSLHTPHYMVLTLYMMSDLLYCNFTLLIMVPGAITNNIYVMTHVVSRVIMIILSSFALSSVHLVTLLAYERYCYFITPLKYIRKFTKCRIYVTAVIIYLIAFCVGLGVDLVQPRTPVATTMTYQAAGVAGQMTNIVYTLFYAIPSCIMSVMTLIRLRLLISKHNTDVKPIQLNDMNQDQSAVGGIIVKPVRRALKMVALVSGSFWLTMIPGFVIRIVLSASGVTWTVTDYRISLPLFALSRASHMMMTILSSLINPLIYVSVLKEMREAAWRCVGIERKSSGTLDN